MVKPILYQLPESPVVRSVTFLAKAINLDIEERYLDLFQGHHMSPEFLKLNPHHCVPTLDDNGHVIWDSHAINIYLVEKYAKNDALYPKDPAKRSIINQRLFFDAGVMYKTLANCTYEILGGATKICEKSLQDIRNAYELFNALFRGNTYLAGDTITLADYSAITNVTQMEMYVKIDDATYPHINPWIKRVRQHIENFDELNNKVIDKYKTFLETKMKENAAAKK